MPIRPSTRFALVLALALSACRNAEAPDASALAADSTPTVSADPTAPDLLPQPEGSSASVPVDLAAGTIGGIDFDAPVDALVRQLGDEAVREEETAVEGEARTVFVFTVEGGEVRRNGALVQYADPRFRTADGLGVGVPVSDFGARYGHTEITYGEESQCQGASFQVSGRHVRACVPRGCTESSCRVERVEFVSEAGLAARN